MRIEKRPHNCTMHARYYGRGTLNISKGVVKTLDPDKQYVYIDLEKNKLIFTPTDNVDAYKLVLQVGATRIYCMQFEELLPKKENIPVTINYDGTFSIPIGKK